MSSMEKELMREYQRDYRVTHSQLTATLPVDLVQKLKKKLKEDKLSYTEFLRGAIMLYLKLPGDNKDGK